MRIKRLAMALGFVILKPGSKYRDFFFLQCPIPVSCNCCKKWLQTWQLKTKHPLSQSPVVQRLGHSVALGGVPSIIRAKLRCSPGWIPILKLQRAICIHVHPRVWLKSIPGLCETEEPIPLLAVSKVSPVADMQPCSLSLVTFHPWGQL